MGSSWGSAASSTFTKNDDGSTTGTNKSQHTPETGKSTNSNHIDSQPSTVRHISTKGKMDTLRFTRFIKMEIHIYPDNSLP